MGVWIPLPQLWPHGGTENDAHTHRPQCSGFDSDEPTQRYMCTINSHTIQGNNYHELLYKPDIFWQRTKTIEAVHR